MSRPEGNSREYLTRQQQNLLLAGPIARLSLDRGVIFRDHPGLADRLDVQYLALSAMDFVMERSAIESGALPAGIVDHVAREATHMKPALGEEQSRKVGQVVLDHLANAREGHKAFREEGTLVPLLGAPMNVTSGMSDEIRNVFAAPSPTRRYDLALLFESCTRPRFRRDPAGAEESGDLVKLRRVPPEFDVDEIRTAQDWLIRAIAARTRLDMKSAIQEAEIQGLAESTLRCVLFLMLRSWCPEDDPLGVIASIDGVIDHERAAGDNLMLAKDAARWPI